MNNDEQESIITEDDFLDMVGDWGMEDSLEGLPPQWDQYLTKGTAAHKSYLAGYIDGVKVRRMLVCERTIAYFCNADLRALNMKRGVEPEVSVEALEKLSK